jgi:putative ABC transport system substrate-binding protein
LQELATDLVRRRVTVIATAGPPPTFAAKTATTTIPIVFLIGDDPARLGLVASLARPGGNLTGINIFNVELAAKRLDLLRELVPSAARIALLVNPADVAITETQVKEVHAAARAIGLQIQVFNADTSAQIDAAFETMGRERPDAIFVGVTPFLNGRRVQLVQLAAFHRLPAIYPSREHAEIGGLMSYGSNIFDGFRQAGVYTGRILKGAKPADLPVVQSSKFELVLNAQTARMLRLTIPPGVLTIADEVIE